jgi:hypothetical protein
MKQINIIGLLLIFSISVWAQQTGGNTTAPEKTQQANHDAVRSAPNTVPQQQVLSPEKKDEGNVIDYEKSRQSPQTVRGQVVKNTASNDTKVREKFGSASTSGEKQVLHKKNVKSKSTASDLQNSLKTVQKVEPKKQSDQE